MFHPATNDRMYNKCHVSSLTIADSRTTIHIHSVSSTNYTAEWTRYSRRRRCIRFGLDMSRHNSAASDGVDHRREKIKTNVKIHIFGMRTHNALTSHREMTVKTAHANVAQRECIKNTIECRTIADSNVKRHWCTRRTRIVRWHYSHVHVPFVCLRLCVRKGNFPWQQIHIHRIYHVLHCVGSIWSLLVQLVKPCSQNHFSFIINYAYFCASIQCRLQ